MPKIVDHDERRSAVVSVTERVIREEGLAAVSIKAIAEAAGSSTAIVSHYFESKQDLLAQTYRTVLYRTHTEQAKVLADPVATLLDLAERLLPLRPEMVGTWRISVEFFSGALSDAEIRAEWDRNLEICLASFRTFFDRMAADGEIPAHVDTRAAAQDMLALIRGIGTEAAITSKRWPRERQRQAVRRLLASIVND